MINDIVNFVIEFMGLQLLIDLIEINESYTLDLGRLCVLEIIDEKDVVRHELLVNAKIAEMTNDVDTEF